MDPNPLLSSPAPSSVTADNRARRSLLRFNDAMRRDWWLIPASMVVVAALTVWITLMQDPQYEGTASLLFDDSMERIGFSSGQDRLPFQTQSGPGLETEMEVLVSREVAGQVVDSLGLTLQVLDREVEPSDLFVSIRRVGPAQPGVYEIASNGETIRVRTPDGRVRTAPARETFELGGLALTPGDGLLDAVAEPLRVELLEPAAIIDVLLDEVEIIRPNNRANLLTVNYRSSDPEMAAAIPNAFADVYIGWKTSDARLEKEREIAALRSQVESFREQLARAEEEVRAFREQSEVIDFQMDVVERLNRQTLLQTRRDTLEWETTSLARLMEEVRAADDSESSPYKRLASFPSLAVIGGVRELSASLTELEAERAELLVRRTPANPDVQAVERRIGDLETQLYELAANHLSRLRSSLEGTMNSLEAVNRQLDQMPRTDLDLARLERDRELTMETFSALQQRLNESEVQLASLPIPVDVLDRAPVPRAPVAPRPVVNLLLGLAVGALLGTAAILTRSRFDPTIRLPEDTAEARLEMPLFAEIPRITASGSTAAAAIGSGNGRRTYFPVVLARGGRPARAADGAAALSMLSSPESPESESFRGLRSSLWTAARGRKLHSILVTSALPGEGKSTTAANLAVAFAEQDVRTLLVDTDFRGGRVHQLFGVPERPGLRELLDQNATLETAIHSAANVGAPASLFVLPAGESSASIAHRRLGQIPGLLARLEEEFDMVILDAPPMGLFADARMLAAETDAVLLVARIGATQRNAFEQTVHQINTLPTPIRGLVLNDVPGTVGTYTAYVGAYS